jgi:acyl carrier protein
VTQRAEEALAALRDAVRVVLETDVELTRETRFTEDLGADSLARVEIAEVLELAGWRLADEDLDVLVSVGVTVDYLAAGPAVPA